MLMDAASVASSGSLIAIDVVNRKHAAQIENGHAEGTIRIGEIDQSVTVYVAHGRGRKRPGGTRRLVLPVLRHHPPVVL